MWWKLIVLAALGVALVVLVVAPIRSVDIHVNMPRSGLSPVNQRDGATIATALAITAFVLSAWAVIGWLMLRVVRHHHPPRNRN